MSSLFDKGLNVCGAAREVGMTRQAIDQKIKKFGIPYDGEFAKKKIREERLQKQKEEKKEVFRKIVHLLEQGYDYTKAGRMVFGTTTVKRSEERKFFYDKVVGILKLFEYKRDAYIPIDSYRLRQERLKRGLRQEELGVQSQISNLETGARVRMSTIKRIAKKLGVPVKDLILDEKAAA